MLRGKDELGQDLVIARNTIAHGMRQRASELLTLELGPQTEQELRQRLERQVDQDRFTDLDRALVRDAIDGIVDARADPKHADGRFRQAMKVGRLRVLSRRGLAEETATGRWRLSSKLEETIRRAGERGDIITTMHRGLKRAGLDVGAIDYTIFDPADPRASTITGRIIDRGLRACVSPVVFRPILFKQSALGRPLAKPKLLRLHSRFRPFSRVCKICNWVMIGSAAIKRVNAQNVARNGSFWAKDARSHKRMEAAMTRKRAVSMTTLEKLGAEKLARLVLAEAEQNSGFKRRVSAALAGEDGPEAVAKIVDRRLAGLERAKSFVEWDKARAFRSDLQSLIDVIEAELIKPAPVLAADRLLRFIATHESVFERVDDSNGAVQDVYYQAITLLGQSAEALDDADTDLLPGRIMATLGESTHGYLVDLTEAVASDLPQRVSERWDSALIKRIAERETVERAGPTDRWHYSMTSQWREMRQILAKARGDLDLVIRLERAKPPRSQDPLGLAASLLDAGRAAEALDWARQQEGHHHLPSGPTNPRQVALEAQILIRLDRIQEAVDLLRQGFEATLAPDLLRAHLKVLPDFDDIEAEEQAMAVARNHPNTMSALEFFMAWPRLDQAAALVTAHRTGWDGGDWYSLPGIADTLKHDYPVAATILYRALLDSILAHARSKAYGHGARYLATLDAIASAAETDPTRPDDLDTHETYLASLKTDHSRKTGFWSRVKTS